MSGIRIPGLHSMFCQKGLKDLHNLSYTKLIQSRYLLILEIFKKKWKPISLYIISIAIMIEANALFFLK